MMTRTLRPEMGNLSPCTAGPGTRALLPELGRICRKCLACLRCNEMMFDLELDSDLIEQRIYERQALLLCRYRYLLARAGGWGCIHCWHAISPPARLMLPLA